MHEASIALSIIDIITGKCTEENYKTVESVRLRIGKAAGIMPEALAFAFDAVKDDTIAKDAELLIDIIPLGGYCSGCCRDFETEDAYILSCPLCGSSSFKINKGYEMEIVEMEVD